MTQWDETRWPSPWGAGQDTARPPSFEAAAQAVEDDWRHGAVCAGIEDDLFFPVGNTGAALIQIEDAKAVCRTCPVMAECFEFALTSGQDFGVWGGTSEDERRAIKRRRNRRKS